ncbi:AraC family transcriptional regulator [Panacagrimonas sp.]|uniref:AraC family transcriptional regulator n=1 Tax=Panacagrimonas sp. TaxID=2480088 RepID=UPI003B527DCB
MAGALVRSIILSGAAEKIRACGRQPAAVARKAGIPAAALQDPDLLVSGRAVMRFFEAAARTCRNRKWGLELALDARFAAIVGPLWVLLRNARSVRELCRDMARHYDLYTNAALMIWEPGVRGGVLGWSPASGQAESEVQVAEFALGVILNEIRLHGPPGWTPPAVWFRHDAPDDLHLHRRLFGPHLHFNGTTNALEIDEPMLQRPLHDGVARSRALVLGVLRQQEDVAATPVTLQVESIVRALLPFAPCTIANVSRALGLPTRTLQARLKAADTSFRAIKDAVRSDLAGKYARHSEMSATQIAGLLGYVELASFSRAFRRWQGEGFRSRKRAGH